MMCKKYVFLGIFCLLFLLEAFTPLHAQDEEGVQHDVERAYGFDGVNGINSDWQPVTHTFANNIEMVLVPPGSFDMGSTAEEVETAYQLCLLDNETCNRRAYEIEMPRHLQSIQEPFWFGKYEVSRAQYEACVRNGVCTNVPSSPASSQSEQPINQVTWLQAKTFCEEWNEGRLPTEAEWEYAARGPSSWTYPWGNEFDASKLNFCDITCEQAWRAGSNDGFAYTAPVNTFQAGVSWVGAYNLVGNLWEWVSTQFRNYPYVATDGRERTTNVDLRVIRGGSYQANVTLMRTHARFWFDPSTGGNGIGFRCVKDINQ